MVDDAGFAKGDLASVMAKHPHVEKWVQDFEARYGSRPQYYGPLDRDAKKERPFNLIYITKEPLEARLRPNHGEYFLLPLSVGALDQTIEPDLLLLRLLEARKYVQK